MTDEGTKAGVETEVDEPEEKTNDLQVMMEKLDALGITTPEELEGKAKAAREVGNLNNLVGDLRTEVAALKQANAETPSTTEAPSDDYGVDIDAAIGTAVNKALDQRETQKRKVYEARAKEIHGIRTNKHYKMVGQKFEQYMGSPEGSMRMSRGETPKSIFNEMVIGEYQGTLIAMKNAVEQSAGNPGQTAVPHVESGQTPPPHIEPSDEKKQKLKKLKENWSGNDSDLEKTINTLLSNDSLAGLI